MMSHISVCEEKEKNFLFRVFIFFCCVMTVLTASVKSDICIASLSFMLFNHTHFVSFYIVIDDLASLFTFFLNSSISLYSSYQFFLYLYCFQIFFVSAVSIIMIFFASQFLCMFYCLCALLILSCFEMC